MGQYLNRTDGGLGTLSRVWEEEDRLKKVCKRSWASERLNTLLQKISPTIFSHFPKLGIISH